jgi:hypothetical protein
MTVRCAAIIVCATACAPFHEQYEQAARDTFASHYTCPDAREIVRRQPAPPEIADDRERADLWMREHHEYTIAGCGESAMLRCVVVGGTVTNPTLSCAVTPIGS